MALRKRTQEALACASAVRMADDQVGLGVDVVEIARMERILERTPSFAVKVFSEEERAYCDATAHPATHYATRFAAKEAVVKALGTGFSQGIAVRDIEVRRNPKGRPCVRLSGRAQEVAREMGVREIPVSLSFTHSEAVACAMAITEGAVAASEKRVDPAEELASRFKDARKMLDELPDTTVADKGEPPYVPASQRPSEAVGSTPSLFDGQAVEPAGNDAGEPGAASSGPGSSEAAAIEVPATEGEAALQVGRP